MNIKKKEQNKAMGAELEIQSFVKESLKGFYDRFKELKQNESLKSDNTIKTYNMGDLADGYSKARITTNQSSIDVRFGNTKSLAFITISGDTNFNFIINNFDENIICISNTGNTNAYIGFNSITCKLSGITDVVIPVDSLMIVQDGVAEVSIISDGNKAYFSWRDDLGIKNIGS